MVRSADNVTATYVQSRKGVIPRVFVWVEAKNRTTGGFEAMGFWNGIDTVDVTVMSANTGLPVTRTYHAWGSLLDVPAIPRKIGLEVRTVRLKLSGISAQVMQAFRGYDPRGGICEIHRGFLDLDSHQIIANPLPLFLGWVNGAPIETPMVGGEGGVELAVVSHTAC